MSLVILISGRGSNMQAILEAGVPVSAVISNRPDAAGLEIAARHGVKTAVVEHRSFADRESFDAALARQIDLHAPVEVALAGSKSGGAKATSNWRRQPRTVGHRASALGVGSSARPLRTNNSSPNASRKRRSALLTAGCVMHRISAARVRFRLP